MVLDTGENHFPGNEMNNTDFEDDRGSLNLRDFDEETDVDSMMMVGLKGGELFGRFASKRGN